jgi:hypothetical protein
MIFTDGIEFELIHCRLQVNMSCQDAILYLNVLCVCVCYVLSFSCIIEILLLIRVYMSIYPTSVLSSEDHFVMFFLKAVCLLFLLLTCEMVQNSLPF